MADRLDLEQLRKSVRRMGPNWVDTDPNFKASWWSIPDRDFQPFADAARFLLSVLDEGGRLERVVLCEHGFDESHRVFTDARGMERCAKGSRTVVWPPKEDE